LTMRKTVKASELDPNFKFEVASTYEGSTVLWCVQCGMCTSNCPYSEVWTVKPHQVIKMVLLGMREEAIKCESIWTCSTCFMCAERCPQGVEIGNVMFALKNMAAREIGVPEGYKQYGHQIYESGRATKITRGREIERSKLGLPEIPRVDTEAIRSHMRKLNLTKLLKLEEEK